MESNTRLYAIHDDASLTTEEPLTIAEIYNFDPTRVKKERKAIGFNSNK